MFEKRVRKAITTHDMFTPRDRIAIGVSGGKDSTALLYSLSKIEKKFPSVSLIPIYIEEGIKNYNESSLPIVQTHVASLGLKLHQFSFQDLYGATFDEIIEQASQHKTPRLPACSYCGILRRRALHDAAVYLEATKLATGHNLDDLSQTLLMNILRGDLSRIAKNEAENPSQKTYIPRKKPFRTTPEREIVLYNYYRGLPYQTQECPYRHEALRNDVRSILNTLETQNPNVKQTLGKTASTLETILRDHFSLPETQNCTRCGAPSRRSLCKTCNVLQSLDLSFPPKFHRK
jgi:uncharacterized protein (TIGR00269 family)